MRSVPPSSRSSPRSSARRSSELEAALESFRAPAAADMPTVRCRQLPGQLRGERGRNVLAQVHLDRRDHQVRRPDLIVRIVGVAKKHQRVAARPVGIARAERQHASDCKLRPADVPLFLTDTLSATPPAVPEGRSSCTSAASPRTTRPISVTPSRSSSSTHSCARCAGCIPSATVTYVQNVTDIDDSILARARKLGVDWQALGDEQTAAVPRRHARPERRRADALRPRHVGHRRRCSTSSTSLHRARRGVRRSMAAACFSGCGRRRPTASCRKLSREQMLEIASQQDDADIDDPRKEDPLDFALWKGWSGRADEPCWPSPWGRGRPAGTSSARRCATSTWARR